MTIEAALSRADLKALLAFGNERFGIAFDECPDPMLPDGPPRAWVVATDGHVLAAREIPGLVVPDDLKRRTWARSSVEAIAKALDAKTPLDLNGGLPDPRKGETIRAGLAAVPVWQAGVDIFPDWASITAASAPVTEDRRPIGLSPYLLARLETVAKAADMRKTGDPAVFHVGGPMEAVRVTLEGPLSRWTVLIMPMRLAENEWGA